MDMQLLLMRLVEARRTLDGIDKSLKLSVPERYRRMVLYANGIEELVNRLDQSISELNAELGEETTK